MSLKQELKSQEKLCKHETLKIWKTGFSVKCPKSTATIYINDKGKSMMLHYWILAKRSTAVCLDCEKEAS